MKKIVIGAPSSGSGKTLITCTLIRALQQRQLHIASFKCGPDYIDPLFHKEVLGVPSKNLDLFFTDEDTTRMLFNKGNDSDLSIIEGVMGLYDGVGGTTEWASTYHLAKTLKAPIILVINAKGMARSILAMVKGYLSMDTEQLIKGIILNQVSKATFDLFAPLIEDECGISVLGYYPTLKEVHFESRYLGLCLPEEVEGLQDKINRAADTLAETVNLDRILEICEGEDMNTPVQVCCKKNRFRIGIAKDEAFCFYYQDNLELLEENGAELVYFSPIHDQHLPENLSGIILGGGYPELFAKELSENETMKQDMKKALESGIPSLAECGGFMYLHEVLEDKDGNCYPMVGMIPGKCFYTGKLVRFGYISIEKDTVIKGHEFHYYDSENNGADAIARKPVTNREWQCAHIGPNHWWGFAHLYYYSNPEWIKKFFIHDNT